MQQIVIYLQLCLWRNGNMPFFAQIIKIKFEINTKTMIFIYIYYILHIIAVTLRIYSEISLGQILI